MITLALWRRGALLSRVLKTNTCKDALNPGQSAHGLLCLSLPNLHHLIHPLLLQAIWSPSYTSEGNDAEHKPLPLHPVGSMERLEISYSSLLMLQRRLQHSNPSDPIDPTLFELCATVHAAVGYGVCPGLAKPFMNAICAGMLLDCAYSDLHSSQEAR